MGIEGGLVVQDDSRMVKRLNQSRGHKVLVPGWSKTAFEKVSLASSR